MNFISTIKHWINKDIVIEISLKGEISEEKQKLSIPFIKSKDKITIFDLENIFHFVKGNNVKAMLFNIGSLNIGLSRANYIREKIAGLTKLGVESHVYLESPGNIEYFIASAADKIYMPKWATLNLIGLSSETFFLKDFFEKIYVEPEIEGKGDYKSAAELFSRDSMSEYNREMINSILDQNFDLIKNKIQTSRNINPQLSQKIFDEGPYLSDEALENKLIDDVCYYDDISSRIKCEYVEKVSFISEKKLIKSINLKNKISSIYYKLFNKKCIIGIVTVEGMITDGENKRGSGPIKTCGAASVIKNLKKASDNKNVAAILVRVLSPGGSALGSDLIRNEISRIREKKPVVISMSDVAASGGYMLSLSSEKIFADEFTLTGSIGIVAGKFNFAKLLNFLEINYEIISRGKKASLYSPLKKFSSEEKKAFSEMIDEMYKNFIKLVSKSRNLDIKSTESAASGRVWTGIQANELNIIDQIGNLEIVVSYLKNKIGIEKEKMPVFKFYTTKMEFNPLGKSLAVDYSVLRELNSLFSGDKALMLMPFILRFK